MKGNICENLGQSVFWVRTREHIAHKFGMIVGVMPSQREHVRYVIVASGVGNLFFEIVRCLKGPMEEVNDGCVRSGRLLGGLAFFIFCWIIPTILRGNRWKMWNV
jgi:hypothetical protein